MLFACTMELVGHPVVNGWWSIVGRRSSTNCWWQTSRPDGQTRRAGEIQAQIGRWSEWSSPVRARGGGVMYRDESKEVDVHTKQAYAPIDLDTGMYYLSMVS